MRIRESLSKGLLVALILTLVPLEAFAAQKVTPGSTCKVYKQKVTYQNKVYTCIKSGKKLVWNKGVAVIRPNPTPTTTPTAIGDPTGAIGGTPTSTPTPTSTLSFQISGNDALLSPSACRPSDSSGNNFHLGFPITPIIRDLSRIRVFAIPFEFTDSDNYRI